MELLETVAVAMAPVAVVWGVAAGWDQVREEVRAAAEMAMEAVEAVALQARVVALVVLTVKVAREAVVMAVAHRVRGVAVGLDQVTVEVQEGAQMAVVLQARAGVQMAAVEMEAAVTAPADRVMVVAVGWAQELGEVSSGMEMTAAL